MLPTYMLRVAKALVSIVSLSLIFTAKVKKEWESELDRLIICYK